MTTIIADCINDATDRELVEEILIRGIFQPRMTIALMLEESCPNWGRQRNGHYGPCYQCLVCLVTQRFGDAL